jgi:hypothetical protein
MCPCFLFLSISWCLLIYRLLRFGHVLSWSTISVPPHAAMEWPCTNRICRHAYWVWTHASETYRSNEFSALRSRFPVKTNRNDSNVITLRSSRQQMFSSSKRWVIPTVAGLGLGQVFESNHSLGSKTYDCERMCGTNMPLPVNKGNSPCIGINQHHVSIVLEKFTRRTDEALLRLLSNVVRYSATSFPPQNTWD